ncbi:MFS general substrate transporter [Delitschia confertaspora ATCC 74209]|uniref:MFS general substrate transporter n=1 Tax=Delitschia confertaspora ATCC 74209 TaxID=1513339 RepID=A0A9P4MTV1_9PLEO|nr:MFS general substrate transporter [Delitschia confertaspora ATCC 74209]
MSEKVMVVGDEAAVNRSTDHSSVEDALPQKINMSTTKWDLRLIPILGCTYTLLFLDRTNIANARIEGLEKGLNMPSNGYNINLWIFFIPFVLIEIPTNILMSLPRIKPNIFLGINTLCLGIIATCQGLTHSYGGLLALRFLLGIFEATLPAGATLLIASYYTRREASLRFALFFMFGAFGPCISGLLAFAIRNMNGVDGKEGWRWIFIIEGLFTIAISVFVYLIVPDFPEKAKFLTPMERENLLNKLHADKGDEKLDLKSIPWLKILTDYKIWFPTLLFFCCDMTAASMTSFIPTILTELGWKAARAQVMSIPIWVTAIVCQVMSCWLSGKAGVRFPFQLGAISFVIAGWIIQIVYVPSPGVRYFSLYLLSGGTFLQMALLTSWMVNNLRGRASIAVGTAIILGLGNCANFVAANVFIKRESPRYPTGFRTGLSVACAGFVLTLIYVGILYLHNRKFDRKVREKGTDEIDTQKEYRYVY